MPSGVVRTHSLTSTACRLPVACIDLPRTVARRELCHGGGPGVAGHDAFAFGAAAMNAASRGSKATPSPAPSSAPTPAPESSTRVPAVPQSVATPAPEPELPAFDRESGLPRALQWAASVRVRTLPRAHTEEGTDIVFPPSTQLEVVPQSILKRAHSLCAPHMRMRTRRKSMPDLGWDSPFLDSDTSGEDEPAQTTPPHSVSGPPAADRTFGRQYAFGTRPVIPAMVPGLKDQTFYDLQNRWPAEYKFVSRSGTKKPNNRIWSEYITIAETPLIEWSEEAISLGGSRDGPVISVQPHYEGGTTSTTVMIAGRFIPVTWDGPWECSWSGLSVKIAHPAWQAGHLHFSTDENSYKGFFTNGKTNTTINIWGVRGREIGKEGRLSVYSPKRRIPPIREDVKKRPFPPMNQNRYWAACKLPPDPGPGRVFASWSTILEDGIPVCSPEALHTIAKWNQQVHSVRKACAKAARALPHGRLSMTMDEVQAVLKLTPLPKDTVIENTVMHPSLQGKTCIERADGSVMELLPRSRSLLPGAVNRNADDIRKKIQGRHPWFDASLPEFLDLGFPHDSHDRSFAIVLMASGQEFHRHILHWVNAYVKERGKTYLNAFTHRTHDTPPAMGGAVVVKKGMVIKPNLVDWRPTINHTAPYSDEADIVPDAIKGGPTPAGDDLLTEPPDRPTVRNEKGQPYSANELIRFTMSMYPPIQYPTPADIGLAACIYLAYGIIMIFRSYDIGSCFHCKSVEGRRAAQSIIIEDAIGPEMKDGFRKSNVVDYGYLDSADISGRVTDIIPNIVDRELNAYILSLEKRKLTPEETEFKRARGALFGIDSSQASLTNSGIYVDDLHNLHPEGHTEKCDEIVLKLGEEMGYTWVIDKKGDGSYIGFTFNVKQFHNSRIHLRKKKCTNYAARAEKMVTFRATKEDTLQSRIGEWDHAAQAELDLKPLLAPFHKCLHAKTRLKNEDLRIVSPSLEAAVATGAPILRASKGLPLFCNVRRPWHYDVTTLTLRTDASLPSAEETSTYNGFGGWFLSRSPDGTIVIYAFFGEWSQYEKEKFGSCIAAAEGATTVFGSILAKARRIMLPHHTDFLELTDSLVAETKYNKLSYGNEMIERSRVKWELHSDFKPFWDGCASIDYIPREWNVGGMFLTTKPLPAFLMPSAAPQSHVLLVLLCQETFYQRATGILSRKYAWQQGFPYQF